MGKITFRQNCNDARFEFLPFRLLCIHVHINVPKKKLNLNSLKNKPKLEIVVARGKLRGYKKEINIFSCYIVPPKLTKAESIDFLTP